MLDITAITNMYCLSKVIKEHASKFFLKLQEKPYDNLNRTSIKNWSRNVSFQLHILIQKVANLTMTLKMMFF